VWVCCGWVVLYGSGGISESLCGIFGGGACGGAVVSWADGGRHISAAGCLIMRGGEGGCMAGGGLCDLSVRWVVGLLWWA
jgi:hypothetical protein